MQTNLCVSRSWENLSLSKISLVDEDTEKAFQNNSSKAFQPNISSEIEILDFSTPYTILG